MAEKDDILTYKGKPLVRNKNKIYYGQPYDKYLLVLTILDNKPAGDNAIPSRVLVQIQDTDPALAFKPEKIVKETEKKGLYEALEIGDIWLSRMLKE